MSLNSLPLSGSDVVTKSSVWLLAGVGAALPLVTLCENFAFLTCGEKFIEHRSDE